LRTTLNDENATIHEVALSDRPHRLAFKAAAVSGGFQENADGEQTIEARRLDSFAIEGDSLVLKIDVEGHEREVMDGASGLLSRCRAIMVDDYDDATVPQSLRDLGFATFESRTMRLAAEPRHLIAIRANY
jgi:FkbM family methyltransferase